MDIWLNTIRHDSNRDLLPGHIGFQGHLPNIYKVNGPFNTTNGIRELTGHYGVRLQPP